MAKRKRRAFTTEFKAQAVRIVRESGKSVGVVARELDLTETALRSWVRQAEIDAGRGPVVGHSGDMACSPAPGGDSEAPSLSAGVNTRTLTSP
jgi:transposase-like protein